MPSPGEDIQSWATVAANNGAADPLINWAEGQARASVNNSARGMMAAHAKNRNLLNGSIVTTGSANAQAFLSGLTYTSIPTNLVVRLKIGAALTNTASVTLNMDGLGDTLIKTAGGDNLKGGELVAGGYVDLLYNGTNWIFLYSQQFIDNQIHAGGGIIIGKQVFSTAGSFTYTPTDGMECCIIECVGGGGGGGGARGNPPGVWIGGGGGSGGYSRKIASAADIGASQSMTVGAGGSPQAAGSDTSVGTLCIAKGGSAGSATDAQVPVTGTAGAGGVVGTGDLTSAGAPGSGGAFNNVSTSIYPRMGFGGSSIFGGGAKAPDASGAGVTAGSYGSGGGGAQSTDTNLYSGGSGSAGVVFITEFAARGAPGHDGAAGAPGPIGPAGPAGPGTGDVLHSGTPTAGQIAQWTDASHIKGVTADAAAASIGVVPNCGRLIYVSATQIKFVPYNGDRIKIEGAILAIPAAGFSLANTGVIVDAVPGSSLAANTTYQVNAYNQGGGGTLGLVFRSTLTHSASTTAGNVGVEIAAIDSFTIVGLIRTNASGQFVDTPAQRFVRSWFNRGRLSLQGAGLPTTGIAFNSGTWASLGATYQTEWLNWSDEAVDILFSGLVYCDVDSQIAMASIGIDGLTPAAPETGGNMPLAGYRGTIASRYAAMPAEGYHYALPLGITTAAAHYGSAPFSVATRLVGTLG